MIIIEGDVQRMNNKKMPVVLYGLGHVGKSMLPYLKERYEIVFWVDGNQHLWGKEYEGILVCSPEKLLEYMGKVIVTTTETYFVEIAEYLLSIGFDKYNIARGQHKVYDQHEEIVPYEMEMLNFQKVNLMDCDLLNRIEEKTSNRVMIFSAYYTPYVIQLIKNCKKFIPGIHFGIISNSEDYYVKIKDYVDHIYIYHSYAELYGILSELPKYDVFQILWIENIWVYFRELIREKCESLNIEVGGSDLYRARKAEQIYKSRLINMADIISAQTESTISAFVNTYPATAGKIRWVNYGIEVLEYMNQENMQKLQQKRRTLNISDDALVIMCGYNASDAHQHIKLIQTLNKLDEFIKEKIILIFPMTYPRGQESYIEEVEKNLVDCGISYRILTEYMSFQEMAEIEMISDILITVQTTDQLSSTMLEIMYAGKVVIAGKWLPYEDLREKGIFFVSIDEIENLINVLGEVVVNYKLFQRKCSANKEIVYDMSSWNAASRRWCEIWGINNFRELKK